MINFEHVTNSGAPHGCLVTNAVLIPQRFIMSAQR
jgi:hypothetical protein